MMEVLLLSVSALQQSANVTSIMCAIWLSLIFD